MKQRTSNIVYCFVFCLFSFNYTYGESGSDFSIYNTTESPPPPDNDICSGATDFGVLDCGFATNNFYPMDPDATPDPEATGNCILNTEPALWYKFTTPSPLPYGSIIFTVGNYNTEIFSTTSGCSELTYVTCGLGIWTFDPEPGKTYYLLITGGTKFTTIFWAGDTCDNPGNFGDLLFDNPIDSHSTTDCGEPSDLLPCENDHTNWYEFTTSCEESDILIEVSEYIDIFYNGAIEVSIVAVLDDCTTLMSEYDADGLGYVCNALTAGGQLYLENLPPNLTFHIGFGSGINNVGYFNYLFTVIDDAPDINDLCPDAIELFSGVNLELTNLCSSLSAFPWDLVIEGCESQSEATVWYTYDPGGQLQDLTININSTGIISPAIAVYDACFDGFLQSNCGTTIELSCIDFPIKIEIASALLDAGTFDIEILSSPILPSDLYHDTCDGAATLSEGLNSNLSNRCSSQSGPPTDATFIDCYPQSASTVWYIFDPGVQAQDITINLLSTGIVSPAIAAFDDCVGDLLSSVCGSSLELFCVASPIFIEVGSRTDESGTFDLDINKVPSVSSLVPEFTGDNICSGTAIDFTITIPSGELVNIIVDISFWSSSLIGGMTTHVFNDVNSANITDILTNSSSSNQDATYTITIVPLGEGCIHAYDYTIVVYPEFDVTEIDIDECLPYLLELNISEVITGGSPSYSSISWFWNVNDLLSTSDTLSLDLIESGMLTLEIIDTFNCMISTDIEVDISIPVLPSFSFPLSYCRSEQEFINFPDTSINNIEGTWNIPVIDLSTTADGFYDLIYTPDDLSCTLPDTLTIEISTGDIIEFNLPNIICSSENEFTFPVEDINGVMGTWETPTIDPSSTSGILSNTFTPNSQSCYAQFEYVYAIEDEIDLIFIVPDSLCKNEEPYTFNNTSNEGYEGSWDYPTIDPSLITSDSFTNTWTPLPGQSSCIDIETITVQIIDIISPEFDLPIQLCSTDSIFVFPTSDLQLIGGSWSIDSIDLNDITEPIQTIFTPDDDCVEEFAWEIEIIEPIVPSFEFDTLLCSLDSNFVLPTESDNGIQGEWSIPILDPALYPGEELIVQFSGTTVGECAKTTEIVINIQEAIDPEFDLLDKLCWTDENLILPTTSLNGVSGVWEPPFIDIQSNIGQSFNAVFMPESGSCFRLIDKAIEIVAPYDVTPIAIDPSDCDSEDGVITLDILSGSNLEFSIDGGLNWQSTNIFGTLSSGGYIILVRSTNNGICELSLEAYLNASDGPIINEVSSTDVNDCMNANGNISIDAQGTNLEYSLDGINWQTNNVFDNLPEGNYEIEIREALSDCIIVASAEIINFPPTIISMVNSNELSDCNVSDGSIEIIADGQALEYSIDNGISWSASNIFSNLDAGNYQIIVQSTEGINCEATDIAILTAPSMPSILNVDTVSPSICNPSTGSIIVDADGNDLEFSIDGGITWQDSNMFSELLSDDYLLIIRDKENINCFEETLVTINTEIDQLEESTLQATMQTDCDLVDGKIEILDNNPELEYSIDSGATWQVTTLFENLASGNYTIISRKISLPDCLVEQYIEIPSLDCPCQELVIGVVADNLSCIGTGSVELTSIIGMNDPGVEIRWQDGTQGAIKDELNEGWQIYTIKYDENCEWIDSIYIGQLDPIDFNLNIQDLECENSDNGTIEVIDETGGNGNYLYSLDGINFQANPFFSGLASNTYEIYVYDGDDCIKSEVIGLLAPIGIDISLSNLDTIYIGETIVVNPEIDINLIDSFSWSPTVSILNPDELIITVAPAETTTYSLEIFYGNCFTYKEITIEVLEEEGEGEDIYIGNIFSPNGDNVNDILYIQGSENIILSAYKIYDRWGNMVFNMSEIEINNEQAGWNGHYQGAKMIPGVYVYAIDYIKKGDQETKIGTVTLIW